GAKPMPSIFISTIKGSQKTIKDLIHFINETIREYMEQDLYCSIYTYSEGLWCKAKVQDYSKKLDVLNKIYLEELDKIVLNDTEENLIKKEIKYFIENNKYYKSIDMLYKKDILIYDPPETGKMTLINVIRSTLRRDICFLNLGNIKKDSELNSAFNLIRSNKIIVLKDVDTQSRIILDRSKIEFEKPKVTKYLKSSENGNSKKNSNKLTLAAFLNCLDGHTLPSGTIIIMTTNHVEKLDSACIRRGRMDIHLELGYCTHYQIRKMYRQVYKELLKEKSELTGILLDFLIDHLNKIQEKVIPTCKAIRIMLTCLEGKKIESIPSKISELVMKYENF
ncbi:11609_t:CDS:1, partial [Diversispora eburnea]